MHSFMKGFSLPGSGILQTHLPQKGTGTGVRSSGFRTLSLLPPRLDMHGSKCKSVSVCVCLHKKLYVYRHW